MQLALTSTHSLTACAGIDMSSMPSLSEAVRSELGGQVASAELHSSILAVSILELALNIDSESLVSPSHMETSTIKFLSKSSCASTWSEIPNCEGQMASGAI